MKLKDKKEDFFSMLLGTLVASLLENMLAGKVRGTNRAVEGRGIARAGYGNKKGRKNNKMDLQDRLIL